MAVPDFQSLMRPLLEAAAEQSTATEIGVLRDLVAGRLQLTPDLLEQRLSSGQTVFVNRLAWAKSFLVRGALLTTGRSVGITDEGRALLARHVGPITRKLVTELPAYRHRVADLSLNEGSSGPALLTDGLGPATPEDLIEEGSAVLERTLRADLLARIHAEPPAFFERFIRDLLLAMGYGGGLRERGFLTGRSGDGGIDGLIHEDALGLDAVYLQAKRYQPGANVPAHELRGFVGSMTAENAQKGVFVTTSGFTKDATAFVDKVTQRIVLIDGAHLAELALRHGVGVRTQRTIAIQRMDEDYFAGED